MYEVYDDVSGTWVLASTQNNWYQSESSSSLVIFVDPTDDSDFQPSKDVTMRVTYSSTYTASATETFVVTFIDPCYSNELTLSSPIPDTEVQIFAGSLNTVIVATSSVTSSILGCTITETFEI